MPSKGTYSSEADKALRLTTYLRKVEKFDDILRSVELVEPPVKTQPQLQNRIIKKNPWKEILALCETKAVEKMEVSNLLSNFHECVRKAVLSCDIPSDDEMRFDFCAAKIFQQFLRFQYDDDRHQNYEDQCREPLQLRSELVSAVRSCLQQITMSELGTLGNIFQDILSIFEASTLVAISTLLEDMMSGSVYDIDEMKFFPFGKIDLSHIIPTMEGDEYDVSLSGLLDLGKISLFSNAKMKEFMTMWRDDTEKNPEDYVGVEPLNEQNVEVVPEEILTKWSKSYLLNLVQDNYILDALITTLSSDGTNEAIQENLFDLLGFEKLDLITELLTNREEIVKQIKNEQQNERLIAGVRQKLNNKVNNGAPVIGVQVHSDNEKQLQKLFGKERKKIHKGTLAIKKLQETEVETAKSIVNKLRTNALAAAAINSVTYPNVYDSKAQAKQKAGFLNTAKIVLPENLQRIQTKEYEEVSLSAENEKLPSSIADSPLIKINDLDEMCQMVFRGMKTLNRIQSMVYEAAYKTNENLLICAPTGAGKTNVALLTILRCLVNNMQDGVIQKDKFKIVYVAPMKALAAEMTANFSKRLAPLGIQVRELTGDMQLSKTELTLTQMLVTTPEKWDVVTRKATGDISLAQIVNLLIIDEVHLLHGDRGPVLEALVARTLRQVESTQKMIRIVGLSATLPNYLDVAGFLRVSPYAGLFYFDSRFRPVPLGQTFIGVKAHMLLDQRRQMDYACYEKVYSMVSKGHQVMVFVHARNATLSTAESLIELATKMGQIDYFLPKDGSEQSAEFGRALKSLEKSRNKKIAELFSQGFSFHHAGMLRSDRNLVEKYFGDGLIKVLVCTATLAWGVNLPAHAVIIKGTEIYDAKHGTFVDLGILDVLQIFGRAGRPQFDTEGHGTIITTHDKLAHYLSLLTNQFPIESSFNKFLVDNLNAEIASGTITNVTEAVEWLNYTYLHIRMQRNPHCYGIKPIEVKADPPLYTKRRDYIIEAARKLERSNMIRFDERTEYLHSTDLGRTASHFYLKYETVDVFNEVFQPIMPIDAVIMLISKASEFEQLKVRDEEMDELDELSHKCPLKVWGGSANIHGKVNILLQSHVSREYVRGFSLISDQQYVVQNAIRICRGFFEIVLRKNNPIMAGRFLQLSLMLEQQLWDYSHPLMQHPRISFEIKCKLENGVRGKRLDLDTIKETSAKDLGLWIHHQKQGPILKRCAEEFPNLDIDVLVQPITRNVLRIKLTIRPLFSWSDVLFGNVSTSFWIWIEDTENNFIYHHEYFIITKKQVIQHSSQDLVFTIPISEPLPSQYLVKAMSDRYLGAENTVPVSFKHLILPSHHMPHTELLDLLPLPITALKEDLFEELYKDKFQFFNSIQTQFFHCLYHTDHNVLLGAPTGSGKTIAAEIAMFRLFRCYPCAKAVYIAPLKALVRERMTDWKVRLEQRIGKRVVELTGDVTPDIRAITQSDVIVTTPEKWDGVSRSWQTRSYVQDVGLIIIDEIHLLGEDRGPVLEVIVSRRNYISQYTKKNVRVVGLSTALANAKDLADWLGISGNLGLYNFRPSVRPVPTQVHVQGFPGKHYCPRMATMNKPAFQAIIEHSPFKPTLIFVSSRRQTRLTALDLIAYLAAENNPKQWLHLEETEVDQIISTVKEPNLKLTLSFGIGIHHAGLQEKDRKVVEELFVNQKIQVLIATATLAWGVNFPAHLVIVKGTEYFDAKSHRYVDMPITDILQMIGRAGRPQFDHEAVAVVLVQDQKKDFYKKFLYEPFPVESSLLQVLPDHLNAEIVAGTICSTQEAMEYLTYTYFFRRLIQNPTYYNLESSEPEKLNIYLSNLISKAFAVLEAASCIYFEEDLRSVATTSFGRIAAYYYLSHQTMWKFDEDLKPTLSLQEILTVLCDASEYSELPVRHNEDILNEELSKQCPVDVRAGTFNSPHTKAHLLFQSHFSHLQLPCSDYYTDLKSVLDQSIRVLQAIIDICAERGWLACTISSVNLMQMIIQARWLEDSPILCLPNMNPSTVEAISAHFQTHSIPVLQAKTRSSSEEFDKCLMNYIDANEVTEAYKVLHQMPIVSLKFSIHFGTTSLNLEPSRTGSKHYLDLPSDTEVSLAIEFTRKNAYTKDLKVHAPKFSKGKDEGWFVIIGDIENRDVIALKRVNNVKRKSRQQVSLVTPAEEGRIVYYLYLLSDSYLGLDQQYELNFNITKDFSSLTTEETELEI